MDLALKSGIRNKTNAYGTTDVLTRLLRVKLPSHFTESFHYLYVTIVTISLVTINNSRLREVKELGEV